MVLDQKMLECLCVGPREESRKDEWEIWHGELDEQGEIFVTQSILRMPHEREVVHLAKDIGAGLDVPVYRTLPGRAPELIQSPHGA